jgi:ribosomal protein L11 methyltransferase
MNDLPAYSKCLNKNGLLFISGFYTEDIADLKAKAKEVGLKDIGFTKKNNWVAGFYAKTGE